MKYLSVVFVLSWAVTAFAGTTEQTIIQMPLATLYPNQTLESSTFVKHNLFSSFAVFLAQLNERRIQLDRWFRPDHFNYVSDQLSIDEQKELTELFNLLGARVKVGAADLQSALKEVGHAILIAKVGRIDADVLHLKDLHKDVIRLAMAKHETEYRQTYGGMRYSYHLREVREVLKTFGFGPKDSYLGLILGTSAWLHDIIEDTDVTYEQILALSGPRIATIVRGVSKFPREEGVPDEDRLYKTYARTAEDQGSRILKVADRTANVQEGLIRLFLGLPTKVHKYFEDWTHFKMALYRENDCEEMWEHLEKLITDHHYAQTFAMANLHRPREWACDENLLPPTLE